jgi:hypothetical protein
MLEAAMRFISIVLLVIFPFVAFAQGSGSTGGAGGSGGTAGATGASPGSGLAAPTGHRQPRATDVPANQGEKDSVQRLQNEKDRVDSRITGSICSNC